MSPFELLPNSLSPAYALLYGALSVVLLYQMTTTAYSIFFSPLSSIPGPWYAALSDAWLLSHAARLRKFIALHDLFEHYGPIVRVGPKRVVFRTADTVKSVYLAGKLPKSSFYHAFLINNEHHAMTALENVDHKPRRNLISGHYSLYNMVQYQPDINEHASYLVDLLNGSASESIDCFHLLRHALLDVMRQSLFGLGPTGLQNWASQTQDPICEAVRDFPIRSVLHVIVPTLLWNLLGYVRNKRWLAFYGSEGTLISFVKQRLEELRKELGEAEADHQHDVNAIFRGPTPLLVKMLKEVNAAPAGTFSVADIIPECVSNLVAGVDTTSSSLGFLLWELSRRQDVVRKLRKELEEVIPDRRTIPPQAVLAKQAYLAAVLNEGFRIHGSVSSLLERVVPFPSDVHKSGVSLDSFDIMGFRLPPGTIVGAQAYSVHRDADVFLNPDVFDPDRWLPSLRPHASTDRSDSENERLVRMHRALMPFGAGTRACPAQHQTHLVSRVFLAALVLNFDFVADPKETNEVTMRPVDMFVIRPASLQCRLRFRPRVD